MYKCKYIGLTNLTVSKSIHAVWETKFLYKIHRTVIRMIGYTRINMDSGRAILAKVK